MRTTHKNHSAIGSASKSLGGTYLGWVAVAALALLTIEPAIATATEVGDRIVEMLEPYTDEIVAELKPNSDLDWILEDAKKVNLTPVGPMVFSYGNHDYDQLLDVFPHTSSGCSFESDTVFTFTKSFEKALSWTKSETLTAGASLTASAEYSSPYGYGGSVSAEVYGEYSETTEKSESTTETTEFSLEQGWHNESGLWTYAQFQVWEAGYDGIPWQQDYYVEDVKTLVLGGRLSWEDAKHGNLPSRALVVGDDGDGANYYACRASRNGGEFIGKVTRSGKCKFYDDEDKQVRGTFEVLVGDRSDLGWTSNSGATSGVTGVTENGKKIYLCRSDFGDGATVPGWVKKGGGKCKVIKNDDAKERSDYKVGLGNSSSGVSLAFSGRIGSYLSEDEREITDRGSFRGDVGLETQFVGCTLDCDQVAYSSQPSSEVLAEHCDLDDSAAAGRAARSTGTNGGSTPVLAGGQSFEPSSVTHK